MLRLESRAEADDEPASEGELVGAVGGNALPEAQQGERTKQDKDVNKKQGLLRELQQEIERLRLLGPRGDVIRVVDDTSSSSAESDSESGVCFDLDIRRRLKGLLRRLSRNTVSRNASFN